MTDQTNRPSDATTDDRLPAPDTGHTGDGGGGDGGDGGEERLPPGVTAPTREAGATSADRGGPTTVPMATEATVAVERTWRRRVAGAPIWSGFAVALAVWILLEFLLAAIDLVPLGLSGTFDAEELWWTGGASVIALFVGGMVTGAASRSHAAADGALQGVVTWAAVVAGVLILSALGAGIGFGALGASFQNTETQAQVPAQQQAQAEQQEFVFTQDQAEEAAGIALLFLGATVIAAGAGGAIGSKMSGTERDIDIDVRR